MKHFTVASGENFIQSQVEKTVIGQRNGLNVSNTKWKKENMWIGFRGFLYNYLHLTKHNIKEHLT